MITRTWFLMKIGLKKMSEQDQNEFIKIHFDEDKVLDFELISFSQGRDDMFVLIVKPVRFEDNDE